MMKNPWNFRVFVQKIRSKHDKKFQNNERSKLSDRIFASPLDAAVSRKKVHGVCCFVIGILLSARSWKSEKFDFSNGRREFSNLKFWKINSWNFNESLEILDFTRRGIDRFYAAFMQMEELRVIEFYSGIGGLHCALRGKWFFVKAVFQFFLF